MGALHIIRKDLLLVIRDRRAIAILIALPLLFISILGLSTGQILGRAGQYLVWLDVRNEDAGELSRMLVDALRSREEFEVVAGDDGRELDPQVPPGDRLVRVRIGREFQHRIENLEIGDVVEFKVGQLAGGLESLDISLEVDNTSTLAIMDRIELRPSALVTEFAIEQIVFGEAMALLVPHVARTDPFMSSYLDNWRAGLEITDEEPPDAGNVIRSFDPDDLAYTTLVPGYTVCFAFFLILYMSRSFLAERDFGTLTRLRAAPISRSALLLGKTLPFLLVSLVQVLLMFGFGRLLFGMPWGPHPWMLLPVLVSTALAATGLGLLVGTTARNDAQATAYGTLLVITLAAISGCFMPRPWMPEFMQQISLAAPHSWALIAYEQLLKTNTPDITLVWQCCAMLVGFGVLFATLGAWRFSRGERNSV